MDDEFDTSVDTSFDDVSSDFSEPSDFDTSSDVGEIMDDSSFDVSDGFEETDFIEYDDSSSDIGELMDEPSDEFAETSDITDIGSDVVEDESEDIESLMDDVSADESSETSDVPTDTDFNVESDIVDLMDEAALETTDETADIAEDNLTPTDEVAELMDEDTSDLTEGDIESLDEVDSSDMGTEGSDDIESLMDTADEEVSNILEESEDIGSDVAIEEDGVSDFMDDTDDSNIETLEVEDINGDEVGENIEAPIEQISEDLDGAETEMGIENLDDSDIETTDSETTDLPSNETSDVEGSAYDRLSEYYSSHNYGQGDYSEYSQDPEWQELNNAYLQEIGQEPIEYGNDTGASAYDNLMAYMSSNNYGQQDAAEYTNDPEWQELNNAYRVEEGMEPIDYTSGDWTDSHVDDMRDELVVLGIPEDSPELDAIIESEQAGIDEINNPSDVNDSSEDILDGVEEVIDDVPAEATDEVGDLTDVDGLETAEVLDETPRVFDDFENSVLEGKPDFYDTGSFYEQGINEFGYQGTCGPTSQANALNKLFDTNEFTENKVLNVAVDNNLCNMDSSPENCGGTTTEQFMELYDRMNDQLDGKIDAQLFEYDNALGVNDVAAKLDEGCVLNVAVDADALWDRPREYVNSMGIPCDDFYSDHWITVTGVQRDELGNVQGFDIIDSGGGVDYVSADKYHDICFGTDDHRVIDPTAIVVSKKDISPTGDIPNIEETNSDMNDTDTTDNGWFQRIFGRRNN